MLLREETDVRLTLVGPWAAAVVALENKSRLEVSRLAMHHDSSGRPLAAALNSVASPRGRVI